MASRISGLSRDDKDKEFEEFLRFLGVKRRRRRVAVEDKKDI
jgi:hypothetical protein